MHTTITSTNITMAMTAGILAGQLFLDIFLILLRKESKVEDLLLR